jgi:hypothetical protein
LRDVSDFALVGTRGGSEGRAKMFEAVDGTGESPVSGCEALNFECGECPAKSVDERHK